MKKDPLELVHGSGNPYRDLGYEDADLRLLKSLLAVEIIKVLDDQGLSVRKANALTGFAAADFSRVRNGNIAKFTVDRLMTMLNNLGARVEVKLRIKQMDAASTHCN